MILFDFRFKLNMLWYELVKSNYALRAYKWRALRNEKGEGEEGIDIASRKHTARACIIFAHLHFHLYFWGMIL